MKGWLRLAAVACLAGGACRADEAASSPVVPAYERFYNAGVPEADPAKGGLLLMAELGCTACHAAPPSWQERLASAPGPGLTGAGARRSVAELQRIAETPQAWSPGTRMPALFHPGAREDGVSEKIALFLASRREEFPAQPAGDVERGRALYHRVGCVACHAPQERPAKLSPDQPLEPIKVPSVSLQSAVSMSRPALVSFLLDPLRTHPAGRMPSSHLSAQEAADVAAYLQRTATEPPVVRRGATPEPGILAEGSQAFSARGCANCHAAGEASAPKPAAPLNRLSAGRGCLAPIPSGEAADYSLAEGQVAALTQALAAVQAGPPALLTPAQAIDWQFSRLDCYACHVRGGKGGPEPGRAAYFTVNDSGIESLGEMGHLPPSLDRVGRKLTDTWMAKLLWGEGGGVRPYMETRMPGFGRAQTEPLLPLLAAADRLEPPVEIDTTGLLPHQRAENGRKLMGTSGLSCVSCHGLKDRPSLGPPVIRLTHTVERLHPEYFKELVLDPQKTQPGTVMPPLLTGRKTAAKDVEAIWTYLRELDGQPLPEGLLADTDFELKPSAEGRPIVFRSFIETAGTHAIGVGFPNGLNACFDARHCRWTLLWKGRFLDAMENWQDRAMKPIKALGTDTKQPPVETAPREFRGYRLEKNGTPVMLYTEGGASVEDKLEPDAAAHGFVRTIERHAASQVTSTHENWSW